MSLVLNGSGTITGLSAGGLPDGSVTTAEIANANVTIAKLSATGTPSSSTYLRGDGAWAAISGTPAGVVIFYAANTAPTGYLKANGAAVSRTTYADLYSAIGTTFGAGDGSTTFNVPDMRGYFPRSWDDGAGRDSGRVFGSTQTDAIRNIVGYLSRVGNQAASPYGASFSGALYAAAKANCGGGGGGGTANNCGDLGFDASRSVPTAAENRPINLALLACIKY